MKRRIISSLIACSLLLCIAASACAGPPTDAIQNTINSVLAIMKKPEMNKSATRPALLKQVEDQILTIFDFRSFSASTVGVKWRSFDEPQRQRFIAAFTELLRATYIEKMSGYSGEKVNYTGEIYSTDKTRAVVRTTVLMGNKVVPVDYMLNNKESAWKVYNIRIETVGLVENYHEQFKTVLLNGSADDLVKVVTDRANQIRRENQNTPK